MSRPLPSREEIGAALQEIAHEAWLARGRALFGPDWRQWRFVCPSCGHVQSGEDFLPFMGEEAARSVVGYACIGRYDGVHGAVPMWSEPGPCNYSNGGLLCIADVYVIHQGARIPVFAFDEREAS